VQSDEGHRALKALRLVDKAFCRAASRSLFRYVVVNTDAELSTIENLVGLIQEYAPFVREILFEVYYEGHLSAAAEDELDEEFGDEEEDDQEDDQDDDQDDVQEDDQEDEQGGYQEDDQEQQEEEEGSDLTLSKDNASYLTFLLEQFTGLKAVGIWPADIDEEGYEYEAQVLVNRMFPQIFLAVAKLEKPDLTELIMPIESLTHLRAMLTFDPNHALVRQFMQRLQHLKIHTITDIIINEELTLENPVLNVAPQLLSLDVSDNCVLHSLENTGIPQTLQLKSLSLSYLELDSYDLLDLLQRSKKTIKFLSLEYIILLEGSWLHVLIQMRKNLKLLELYFMGESFNGFEHSAEGLFFENIPLPPEYILHALGDLQRQINANRVAEGLEPFSTDIFEQLNLLPLGSIIPRAEYDVLMSRSWDFREDGNL
jgi:hypothetical protein